MATTADGQWNQRDKLWLRPVFEINGKLVDTSALHKCKKMVLRQSITSDLFSLSYTWSVQRFLWGAGAALLIPSLLVLNWWGVQSPCVAEALAGGRMAPMAERGWKFLSVNEALRSARWPFIWGTRLLAPSAFRSWSVRKNKTDFFTANWDQMHFSV